MAMKPVFAKLQAAGILPEGIVTTSSKDSDGKELKFRIINCAYKLRNEWKDTKIQIYSGRRAISEWIS